MKKKSLISSIVILTTIIFGNIINEITKNYLLSVLITASIEIVILDVYYLLFTKKLSFKVYITAAFSIIGLFICFLYLFNLLISIMLIIFLLTHLFLLSYLIVYGEDNTKSS